MIRIRNLSKKFGKLKVLQHLNMDCEMGQCIALIGPNGCGKTTLIKSILGMVLPDEGEIFVHEKNIKNDVAYRCHIGYMPQIGRYPDNMKVAQVLSTIKHIRTAQATDEELLHTYHLHTIFEQYMHTLSGGTVQKVSAALAFLFNPDILILDEPTAGLDPLAAELLKEKIIAEKEKGKLILITSHQLSELDDLVSQIVLMQEGKVVLHQNIEALKAASGEQKLSKAISNILRQQQQQRISFIAQ